MAAAAWWYASGFSVMVALADGAAKPDRGMTERLEAATRPLLGATYRLSPLGEGAPPDADPRWRLDAFDCTTFVETAIALASADAGQVPPALDRLRYQGGEISFEARLHLVESQWLPHLTRLGVLSDITDTLLPGGAPRAALELTRDGWRRRRVARHLSLPEDTLPFGTTLVPYLPLAVLPDLYLRIPPGSLLNVVRAPNPAAPTLVTHQALLLELPGGARVIRHASAALHRVADQTPAQFHRLLTQRKRWPILGLNVQNIAALPGAAASAPR